MAMPKCPNPQCASHSFEMKEIEVRNSRFKLNAVNCTVCGSVITITEFLNLGATLERIENRLEKLRV